MPENAEKYRPNVALLLLNNDDELLICERVDADGCWQFPQGGVDKGEGLISAIKREIEEEIGLTPDQYEIVDSRTGYKYKYPPGVREKKKKKHNCVGQEQTYFICRLIGSKKLINVDQDPPEFQDHKWIKPSKFKLNWIPKFKHDVYLEVFQDFFSYTIN